VDVVADGHVRGRIAIRMVAQHRERSYFETMAVPIVRGRVFAADDRAGDDDAAIVNESFARRYWRRPTRWDVASRSVGTRTVVGVARDGRAAR
jgi:hypothetical protein